MKINCFLPCRKGSERVPKKNIKHFANIEFGLIEIKLKQLLACDGIKQIFLSTNDEEILEFASSFSTDKLVVHKRCEELSSSSTSTDDLISHALDLIPKGHILWTHVTSPFVTASDYDNVIEQYSLALKEGYDSLMSTNLIHGFLWNTQGPINYDRNREKWPRTQTIKPIHEINSAVFLNSTENYKMYNDRIGKNPYLYPMNKIQSFDIDWEEDFKIAEAMFLSKVAQI